MDYDPPNDEPPRRNRRATSAAIWAIGKGHKSARPIAARSSHRPFADRTIEEAQKVLAAFSRRPGLGAVALALLAVLLSHQSEGAVRADFGLQASLDLLSRGVATCVDLFPCGVPPAPCVRQADFGVRPHREFPLCPEVAVFEPPEFAAVRHHLDIKAREVGELVRLAPWLGVADGSIGQRRVSVLDPIPPGLGASSF